MKKIFLIVFTALSAVFVVSCANEKLTSDSQTIQAQLEASDVKMEEVSFDVTLDDTYLGSDGTRVALGEYNSVVWESKDSLAAFYVYNSSYYLNKFKLSSGAGQKTGTFYGYIPSGFSGDVTFLYPVSVLTGKLSSNGTAIWLNIALPSTQSYVAGNIAKGANVSMAKFNVSNSSKYSSITLSGLSLYNVGGILRLNIKGDKKVSKIVLTNNDGFLCGDSMYLNTNFGTNPSNYSYESASGTSSSLTLDCGKDGVQLSSSASTQFNFVIPANRLSGGFTVTVYDTDGGVMSKTAPALTQNLVSRNTLLEMPEFTYAPLPEYISAIIEPGFYSNPSSSLTKDFSFVSSGRQCFYSSGDCYVQDWANNYSVKYALPASPVAGQSYDITMTTEIGSPASQHKSVTNVKFVASFNELLFFESSDASKVYVFSAN